MNGLMLVMFPCAYLAHAFFHIYTMLLLCVCVYIYALKIFYIASFSSYQILAKKLYFTTIFYSLKKEFELLMYAGIHLF